MAAADRSDVYYLDLIGQLQAHHLLYWNVENASYEFTATLRHLLAHGLELDDPQSFAAAHLAAYNYHRKHIEAFPQYLGRYVPEAAYHGSVLATNGMFPTDIPTFASWWKKFLADAPDDVEPWDELRLAMESDAELPVVMPSQDYQLLRASVLMQSTAAQRLEEKEDV